MYLHQYDYIFGIGTVFAMLDAFNNGASEYTIHEAAL
jgi:sodium-dependent phosphate transporter